MKKQKLTKPDLINEMAAKFEISKTAARNIIDTYNEMLEYCILNRIPVQIIGLYDLTYEKKKGKTYIPFGSTESTVSKDKLKPIFNIAKALKSKIEDYDD